MDKNDKLTQEKLLKKEYDDFEAHYKQAQMYSHQCNIDEIKLAQDDSKKT